MQGLIDAIFIIIFVVIFSIGTVNMVFPEKVKPELWNKAEELCKNNEGILYLEYDVLYSDAKCNNGAEFQVNNEQSKEE